MNLRTAKFSPESRRYVNYPTIFYVDNVKTHALKG